VQTRVEVQTKPEATSDSNLYTIKSKAEADVAQASDSDEDRASGEGRNGKSALSVGKAVKMLCSGLSETSPPRQSIVLHILQCNCCLPHVSLRSPYKVGAEVGASVTAVGAAVGAVVGASVGAAVGAAVGGMGVGEDVG
jgi:hypothetical protein